MLEICTPDTDCTVEFTILNSNEKRETTFTFSWSVFGPDLPQGSAGLHLPGPHSPGAAPAWPSPTYRSGGTAAGWRTAHRRRRGSAPRRAGTWAWAAGPRWRWSRLSDASGKEESGHLVLQDTSGPGVTIAMRPEAGAGRTARGGGPTPSRRSTYESGGCCPGRACPGGGWEWRLATTWRCCGSGGGPTCGQGVGEKSERGGSSASGRALTGGFPSLSCPRRPDPGPLPPPTCRAPPTPPRSAPKTAGARALPGFPANGEARSERERPRKAERGDAEPRGKGGRR